MEETKAGFLDQGMGLEGKKRARGRYSLGRDELFEAGPTRAAGIDLGA
jgi:hypothetical protein